jgi:two-component system, OmpR family, KDP operon response regulator KdpE
VELTPMILLVEDDAQMRRFLRVSLSNQNYRLKEAISAQEGLTQASTQNPDLILLDLGLPDMDGLEVTRRVREWSNAPIIVISARGREQDKVDALDAGADDYLTKPFGTGELFARIRVALRHARHSTQGRIEPILTVGEIVLDLDKHTVTVAGSEVHLTPIEYKLLALLLKNAGKVLTHRQLLKEVWGAAYAENTQYLRVYMVQLRHKLERDPARPRYLVTEPGVGYRLRTEE